MSAGEDSWLAGMSKAMQEASERRRVEQAEFHAKLPAPVYFVADPDDPELGVGWFRAEGGFVAFPKYKNGYHPKLVGTLTDELVAALAKEVK